MDGDWSVEKVLQVIINNCRSWRGEGLKVRRNPIFSWIASSNLRRRFLKITSLIALIFYMNLYYGRCLLNYVSRMSKRVIPKSFSFHMCGSLYYRPGIFPSSSFFAKSMHTLIAEIKTKLAVPHRISWNSHVTRL